MTAVPLIYFYYVLETAPKPDLSTYAFSPSLKFAFSVALALRSVTYYHIIIITLSSAVCIPTELFINVLKVDLSENYSPRPSCPYFVLWQIRESSDLCTFSARAPSNMRFIFKKSRAINCDIFFFFFTKLRSMLCFFFFTKIIL